MRWLIVFLLLPLQTFAEAIYPKTIPIRWLGADQKEVGSCRAEAEVSALEHAFAEKNLPVLLSSFHRHAYNWRPPANNGSLVLQEYVVGDKEILEPSTYWPLYLWPEDARGFARPDPGFRRMRPPLQQMAVIIPELPRLKIESTNFTFTRPKGADAWSNSPIIGLDQLKQMVRERVPLVLSIHADILAKANDCTGLLSLPYSRDWLPQDPDAFRDGLNHAVAVVGFDDDLYDGQGAFVVHNSWNEDASFQQCSSFAKSAPAQIDLAKLRYKVSAQYVPGYYALPYAYFRDLIGVGPGGAQSNIASGASGVTRLEADYAQVFDVYTSFQKDVSVYAVPFVCDRSRYTSEVEQFEQIANKQSSAGHAQLLQFLITHAVRRTVSPFQIARLSSSPSYGFDRVKDLSEGKLWSYYCAKINYFDPDFDVAQSRFPNADDYNDPKFKEILENFAAGENSLTTWYRFFSWSVCKKNGGLCL